MINDKFRFVYEKEKKFPKDVLKDKQRNGNKDWMFLFQSDGCFVMEKNNHYHFNSGNKTKRYGNGI